MSIYLPGSWRLVTWRRVVEGGETTYPLGTDPIGVLIYTHDGHMAVQMLARERAQMATDNSLGGTGEEQSAAYSSCLAYYGTYTFDGESVTHKVEGSLFPNWSATTQVRPVELCGEQLILKTPPTPGPTGTVVNEIVWERIHTST